MHFERCDPTTQSRATPKLASTIAKSVGTEVRHRRANDFTWTTKSSTTDVVTEIDTWCEEEVVRRISESRPDDGFLGEEGTSTVGTSGVRWVIDPVDGTTNLLYDLPGYGVSIAAQIDEVTVAGAVFDPIRDEMFSGAIGEGATLDGRAIRASDKSDLATALVGTGFSYLADGRTEQAEQLVTIISASARYPPDWWCRAGSLFGRMRSTRCLLRARTFTMGFGRRRADCARSGGTCGRRSTHDCGRTGNRRGFRCDARERRCLTARRFPPSVTPVSVRKEWCRGDQNPYRRRR